MEISDKSIELMRVCCGKIKAELVLKNGRIPDLINETIIEADMAVHHGTISGIGEYSGETEIDLAGKYLLPGFIDAHVHIESSLLTPSRFAEAVLPHGTTCVVADPHEIANVCGLDGIRYMVESSQNIPLDVFFMLPSCVPATEFENAGAVLEGDSLVSLKGIPRVIGLGEMMNYPGVINGDRVVHHKLSLFSDGMIDGHSPGLSGKGLNAYAAAGIRTDHECVNIEEMEERLRLGMYVLIREGSATRNLEALIKGVTEANIGRIAFCTDDKQPGDIHLNGHINNNVNKAIRLGLSPLKAIRMATLNPANIYGLNDRGLLAPGYKADFMVCDSLEQIIPEQVYHNGIRISDKHHFLVEIPEFRDKKMENTIYIGSSESLDFSLKLKQDIVRVIKIVKDNIITKESVRKVELENGCFAHNDMLDILKLAVIERHKGTGNIGLGLITGYGLKRGAVAVSIAHDSHNIICTGTNDEDMKLAVETLKKISGGMAICEGGDVIDYLPLEVGGLMTNRPSEEVRIKLEQMIKAARDRGVKEGVDPFMTLAFMALPVIPKLKLTDKGLFDVTRFCFVDPEIKS